MKRASDRTNYVMLKAFTTSEWDQCDFVILHITDEWKETMKKRLEAIGQFKDDLSFNHQSYFESPVGFYKNADDEIPSTGQVIGEDENWCFVEMEKGDLSKLSTPESRLDSHQILINKYKRAYFTACGKNSGEQFSTEFFRVAEMLGLTDTEIYQACTTSQESIALKQSLLVFDDRAHAAVRNELKRINRPVRFANLSCDPFNQDTIDYIEAIRLSDDGGIVFDTSFANITEKDLPAMLSDNEICHWGVIDLLEMLESIE